MSLSLFICFILITLIQLIYYWFLFSRLAFFNPNKEVSVETPPISVIICAKNEYDNLERNLPFFLEQNYPKYEILVVNDNSDDETTYLLKEFADKYNHFKYVSITGFSNYALGKKFPLAIGIKSAQYDTLLLTDADCIPASNNWISSMQKAYTTSKTEIVLGYGAYKKRPGFLNKLIRYDAFFIGLQYLSFSLAGFPYMGIGRNLSYKKDLFFKNKGFSPHYNVMSGDDDLFINRVAKKENVSIQIEYDSHTYSEPKPSFYSWVLQKRRHFSTSYHYKFFHRVLLGLLGLSSLIFYMLLLILLLINFQTTFLIIIFGAKFISQTVVFYLTMNKLNEKDLFWYFIVFDLFMIFINPVILISGLLFKKNKWK
ncbi:MAG: hypothetical protein A2X02_00200 [Bacteroidetes bacterium GWF2_29_10]|nr:MAG: hypothetical protein A2X02_00200 [Bacteroidetes bacterium GWF2_29_10]